MLIFSCHFVGTTGIRTRLPRKFGFRGQASSGQARHSLAVIASCLVLVLLATALPSQAEPLDSALARTYRRNPAIQAALASVKATAELLPQARAGYLPNLSLQGTGEQIGTRQNQRYRYQGVARKVDIDSDLTQTYGSLELILQINLYAGGATRASLTAAEAEVAAALATLDGTVSQVLLSVTSAYADVLRLSALIQLNDDVEQQLRQLEKESRSLFAKRLGTLTDVAQASGSVARAGAQRTSLSASLSAARSNYLALSGQAPEGLKDWPSLPPLPKALEEIKDIAEIGNPSLLAARFGADSARLGIEVAKSGLRPTVDFYTTYQQSWDQTRQTGSTNNIAAPQDNYRLNQPEEDLTVGVQLNVPLFSGGQNYSRVRQANANFNQSRNLMTDTYNQVMSAVETDWSALEMARERSQLVAEEVKAARQTLEGFYRQFQNGLSTMKDVLDARQSLDAALEQQIQARYDLFMGQASLLQVMGRYTPLGLGIPVESLGAENYVEAVRYRLIGTSID